MDDWVSREDIEYALEWYGYGLKKGNDWVIKFMMHWIAFNWLYGQCEQGDEVANIREFCRKKVDDLARYDAFKDEAFREFKKRPITGMKNGKEITYDGIYRNLSRGSDLNRITNLLLSIYQVRCNLFHGSKSLRIEHDRELVHSSAIILEGYLKELLPKNPIP